MGPVEELERAPTSASMVAATDFLAPPTIPHYEPGPVTRRTIERNGMLWAVIYHAEQDENGWRVRRVECRPEEDWNHQFAEGDIVHVRLKVVEDGGDQVRLMADDPGGHSVFWLKRGRIVRVERPEPLTPA